MAGWITYLNYFQGEVVYLELITDEHIDYRHKTEELKSFYIVNTDKQKYLVFLLEFTLDTDHHDNVGLYPLWVIKAEDKETQFGSWQKMKIAGSYK